MWQSSFIILIFQDNFCIQSHVYLANYVYCLKSARYSLWFIDQNISILFSSKHEYTNQAKSSQICITKDASLQKYLVFQKISYQYYEKLSIILLTLFFKHVDFQILPNSFFYTMVPHERTYIHRHVFIYIYILYLRFCI